MWWSWTAPASGTVRVDTIGSGFNTALGIYTGILLGSFSARPFWNSGALGPLFLVSGMSSAAILPILAGFAWSLAGVPLSGPIDATLALLGSAAPVLCLILLGSSLVSVDPGADVRLAMRLTLAKSVMHPLAIYLAAVAIAIEMNVTARFEIVQVLQGQVAVFIVTFKI